MVNLDKSQLNLGIWAGNETAAAPPSRLPPGIPLPEPGPAFVGPRAPRCHLPPPSLGSDYIEPGGSCGASAGKLFFCRRGVGSRVRDEKGPLFPLRGPAVDSRVLEFTFHRGALFCLSRSGFSCAGRGAATRHTWTWSGPCYFTPLGLCRRPRAAHGVSHAASHVKARRCDRRRSLPSSPSLRVPLNCAGFSAPLSGLTTWSPGGSPGFG